MNLILYVCVNVRQLNLSWYHIKERLYLVINNFSFLLLALDNISFWLAFAILDLTTKLARLRPSTFHYYQSTSLYRRLLLTSRRFSWKILRKKKYEGVRRHQIWNWYGVILFSWDGRRHDDTLISKRRHWKHTHTHISLSLSLYIYIYIYIYVCVCVCVCVCVFNEINERERERFCLPSLFASLKHFYSFIQFCKTFIAFSPFRSLFAFL